MSDPLPRVLTVLVVSNASPWLDRTIEGLRAQAGVELDLVVVDNNSTDGSLDLLIDAFGPDAVLASDTDLGFAAGVRLALEAVALDDDDLILLLHDDCALAPNAARLLAEELVADPQVWACGPKLLDWDEPGTIREVGAAIDASGRVERGLETNEVDQGQHDGRSDVMVLPDAALMVRTSAVRAVGGLDDRLVSAAAGYDLTWRFRQAGGINRVVPQATALHAHASAAGRREVRAGNGDFEAVRASSRLTMLLSTEQPRLLPLAALLAVGAICGRVVGSLLTRRANRAAGLARALADAWLGMRQTRQRRAILASVRDANSATSSRERAAMTFGLRAAVASAGAWLVPEISDRELSARERAGRFLRRHPILGAALVVLFVTLPVTIPLAGASEIVGGQFEPWPSNGSVWVQNYLRAWHPDVVLAGSTDPSPAQLALWLVDVVSLGNAWIAARLLALGLLVGAFASAWLVARAVIGPGVPPTVAATVYAASGPVVAAWSTAQLDAMVSAAVLPAAAYLLVRAGGRSTEPAAAWRASALAAFAWALVIAFAPELVIVLLILAASMLTRLLWPNDQVPLTARLAAGVRVLVVAVGAFLLLTPWSWQLSDGTVVWSAFAGGDPTTASFGLWRWAVLAADGVGLPPLAWLLPVAALVLGLGLPRFRQDPLLWAVSGGVAIGAVATMWTATVGVAPTPLASATLVSFCLSLVIAQASGRAYAHLQGQEFGMGQLAIVVGALCIAVTSLGSLWSLTVQGRQTWTTATEVTPAFVSQFAIEDAPTHVLHVVEEADVIRWDVTGSAGPTMLRFGQPVDPLTVQAIDRAIARMSAGTDPRASDLLGHLGIRWVRVRAERADGFLAEALGAQRGLEPIPTDTGLLYGVGGWRQPFVTLDADGAVVRALSHDSLTDMRFVVEPGEKSLAVTAVSSDAWESQPSLRSVGTSTGTLTYELDDVGVGEPVRVFVPRAGRMVALAAQMLVVLSMLSLALRPPAFAVDAIAGPPRPKETA